LLDEWSTDNDRGHPHQRNRAKERQGHAAPQPQATIIAIHSASTTAMITPRPHTTLGSVSFAGALRQSNRKRLKRRWAAMPTQLNVRIVDAGLPPEVVGLVAFCGNRDMI
jgi:hypothetical protein